MSTDSRTLLDYDQLFSQGLKLIESFSSETWTDYNSHDPGITIMEYLCYNLTDLALRTSSPIEDLVAEKRADASAEVAKHFFQAHEILTLNPTSFLDYRKLMLSEPYVHNATLETPDYDSGILLENGHEEETLKLQGLYEVYLEFDDEAGDAIRQKTTRQLNRMLQHSRNLCEDFLPIKQFPYESVAVLADIEIEHDVKGEDVLSEVALVVDRFISPPVSFRTLAEVLEANVPTEQIFNGPRTKFFFEDMELNRTKRKKAIHVSDIINEIMGVDGVLSIRRMNVSTYYGQSERSLADNGIIRLQDQHTLRFSLDKSKFRLFKNGGKQDLSDNMVKHKVRVQKMARMKPPVKLADNVLGLKNGRYHNLEEFKSIQHDFPPIYNLGEAGVPSDAADEQRAYIRQLRAYLSLFDRFLADYLANLAQAKNMLSIRSQHRLAKHSLFVQGLQMPEEAQIIRNYETYLGVLNKQNEPARCYTQRRDAFLNHLLARFATNFTSYEFMALDKESNPLFRDRIEIKQKFLERYDRLSHDRGKGIDGLRKDEASAFEECFRILLQTDQVYLVEHILLRPRGSNSMVMRPYLEVTGEIENEDPYSFTVSVTLPAWMKSAENIESRELIEKAIRNRLPAHIFARILWLDYDRMNDFEQLYHSWRSDYAQVCGHEVDDSYIASQNNLVRLLDSLFSVSLQSVDVGEGTALGGATL